MQLEVDGAFRAHAGTRTLLACHEAVDLLAHEWYQTEPMSKELIMQSTRVLLHFNQIYGHGWHLRDHDAAKSIGHGQICLKKLKLYGVAQQFYDFDLACTSADDCCLCCILKVLVETYARPHSRVVDHLASILLEKIPLLFKFD